MLPTVVGLLLKAFQWLLFHSHEWLRCLVGCRGRRSGSQKIFYTPHIFSPVQGGGGKVLVVQVKAPSTSAHPARLSLEWGHRGTCTGTFPPRWVGGDTSHINRPFWKVAFQVVVEEHVRGRGNTTVSFRYQTRKCKHIH
mgnify:CR=1 FL=1